MKLARIRASRRRRRLLLGLVANGLAQAAAGLAAALLARAAVEAAQTPRPLAPLLLGLVGISAVLVALKVHQRGAAEQLGQHYVSRVRRQIFRALARAGADAAARARYGLALTRLVTDLGSLRGWAADGVARSLVAGATIAGLLAALAWLSPRAAACAGGFALLWLAVARSQVRRLREAVRRARRRRGRLAAELGEKVQALPTLNALGRVDAEIERIRRQSRGVARAMVARARAGAWLRALPEAGLPLVIAALVVAGSGSAHALAADDLAATLLLVGLYLASLRDLALAWHRRVAFEQGRERIEELLADARPAERGGAELPAADALSLELVDVRLPGAAAGFTGRAEAGERVLLTGASGCGKSRLLAALAGELRPERGEIRFDGTELRRLQRDAKGRAVALVSPRLPLLRGSLAENLLAAGPELTPGGLAAICRLCGIDGDPAAIAVDEGGRRLPTGLRARALLARALAGRPRLLLVDDPAFAADAGARRALARVLDECGATAVVACVDPLTLADGCTWHRVWRLGSGSQATRS